MRFLRRLTAGASALALFVVSGAAFAAPAVYPPWVAGLLAGTSGYSLNGTVKCVLVDSADYTYSAAHDFYDDIPGAARVGTAQTLASKTYAAGAFDAADITFTAVTGDPVEAVACFVDTAGADSADPLVVYLDGISVTPNGGDITISWAGAPNFIFRLV